MEEITITPIEWSAPEYSHKEKTVDWFWTIGLLALVGFGIAVWFHNYLFAIFILISGASLILFTLRAPQVVPLSITSDGISMGKEKYEWKQIKGFRIKSAEPYSKLLILTSKKFLPLYTISFPKELTPDIREALTKATTALDLEESHSMLFMEKIGF